LRFEHTVPYPSMSCVWQAGAAEKISFFSFLLLFNPMAPPPPWPSLPPPSPPPSPRAECEKCFFLASSVFAAPLIDKTRARRIIRIKEPDFWFGRRLGRRQKF
jgi:hypothetical protein